MIGGVVRPTGTYEIVKKRLLIALLITMMVSMVIANAEEISSLVGVTLSDASFAYNGREVILKDAIKNKPLKALQYDNNLYVPIQAIVSLTSVPMTYNEKENKYEIGLKSSNEHSLIDIEETSSADIKYFVKTIDPGALTINKQTFESGLALLKPKKGASYSKTFSLKGAYTKLVFTSVIDGPTVKDENVTLKFVDTEKKKVVAILLVGRDKAQTDYEVKVTGINKLQLVVETGDREIKKYIIGDAYLK